MSNGGYGGLTPGYNDGDEVSHDNSFEGHGVSQKWVMARSTAGAKKASPERLKRFHENVGKTAGRAEFKSKVRAPMSKAARGRHEKVAKKAELASWAASGKQDANPSAFYKGAAKGAKLARSKR